MIDRWRALEARVEELESILREFPVLPSRTDHTSDELLWWLGEVNEWKLRVRDLLDERA